MEIDVKAAFEEAEQLANRISLLLFPMAPQTNNILDISGFKDGMERAKAVHNLKLAIEHAHTTFFNAFYHYAVCRLGASKGKACKV